MRTTAARAAGAIPRPARTDHPRPRRLPAIIGAIVLLVYAVEWGSSLLLNLCLGSIDLPRLAWKSIWWTQDLLVVSLAAVFAAVAYHALRLEKEGVDVSELTQVFA